MCHATMRLATTSSLSPLLLSTHNCHVTSLCHIIFWLNYHIMLIQVFRSNKYDDICQKLMKIWFNVLVPEIMFWNVECSDVIPLPSRQKEVVFLNGYTKRTLEMFIHNDGDVNLVDVMEVAIAGESTISWVCMIWRYSCSFGL